MPGLGRDVNSPCRVSFGRVANVFLSPLRFRFALSLTFFGVGGGNYVNVLTVFNTVPFENNFQLRFLYINHFPKISIRLHLFLSFLPSSSFSFPFLPNSIIFLHFHLKELLNELETFFPCFYQSWHGSFCKENTTISLSLSLRPSSSLFQCGFCNFLCFLHKKELLQEPPKIY